MMKSDDDTISFSSSINQFLTRCVFCFSHLFELLFQELQLGCPSARNDLIAYVISSSDTTLKRRPIPSHVFAILGL